MMNLLFAAALLLSPATNSQTVCLAHAQAVTPSLESACTVSPSRMNPAQAFEEFRRALKAGELTYPGIVIEAPMRTQTKR